MGTHSGTFHADEIIAFVILDELFESLELVRTRNDELLSTCDLVFDVGGGTYDHHTNDKEYRENGIPYAAAGLVWRDFGQALLAKKGFPEHSIEKVFLHIDKQYMQGLDAIDNGVRFNREIIVPDLTTDLHRFNPKWNKDQHETEQFYKAVEYAKTSFLLLIEDQLAKIAAKGLIHDSYLNREKKEILLLDQHCPWHQALLEIDVTEEVLFVIYKDPRKGYLIQSVPINGNTFESRKDLPLDWAGKSSEELNEILDIKDAIFAHPARFIAGAKSKDSIMKMADKAISE